MSGARLQAVIIGCLHDQADIVQTSSKHRANLCMPIGTPPLGSNVDQALDS